MFEEFVERYSFLVPVGGKHSSHRELAEVENNTVYLTLDQCVCVHMCVHVCAGGDGRSGEWSSLG